MNLAWNRRISLRCWVNSNLSSPLLNSPFTYFLPLSRLHPSLRQSTQSELMPQWTLCSIKEIRFWHRRIFILIAHFLPVNPGAPFNESEVLEERKEIFFSNALSSGLFALTATHKHITNTDHLENPGFGHLEIMLQFWHRERLWPLTTDHVLSPMFTWCWC